MADSMKLWNAVSKTDPAHTNHVNQRGGFTAIAAHSQIMKATEQFGPVGEGWGYECGAPVFHDKFIMIPVTIWHGSRENTFGPILGCAEILGNRPDSDAPKKAMTDAITKGLSQLGFNADVFLGMFDDNKYVQERTREAEREKEPQQTPAQSRDAMKAYLSRQRTIAELEAAKKDPNLVSAFKALPEPMQLEITKHGEDLKAKLEAAQ